MTQVVLAVDGNSLLHRSYHAQASTGLRTADGRPMWAVRGLLSQLVAAVDRIGPDAVVVGLDDPDSSQRRTIWPPYKAQRADKLDTLVSQLLLAAEVLRDMGVCVVVPPGLEADDVLASTARQATAFGATTVVVTSDRDAFALINESTHVLRIINGGIESSPLITADRLETLLGIRPKQYLDYAALRGDPSDNLPGVRGFGPKTAARLLASVGCAKAAFDDPGAADVISAIGPALAARLSDPELRAAWQRNRTLMTLRDDVPVSVLSGPQAAGRLPLDVSCVHAAFALTQLTWTAAEAVRVMCGESTAEPEGRAGWDTVPANAQSWVRRPPPLRRQPVSAQLALFD